MFEEFEVVCPKCKAILRLSANSYGGYISNLGYTGEKKLILTYIVFHV